MLVVTGPSGNVGAELVQLLARDDAPRAWRVASRHPVHVNGAEAVRFDFFDRDTWAAALDRVQSLFLLFPLPGNKAARAALVPFVQAAQQAGCRHVVYVSVFGADRARFIPHHTVEKALRESRMTWTVLRCGFFMQNLHRAISTHGIDITEHHELFIPAGRGATAFLDARDAAAVAAAVLDDPDRHRNVVHHLSGPRRWRMAEVADELSAALGYRVRYTNPNLIAFARRLRARGVGWDTVGFMAAVYTLTRFGANQQITADVQRLLGRPPGTLEQFLRDSAWRFRDQVWT